MSRSENFFRQITNWSLYLAVFLIPLFFLPTKLDPHEINKQSLLILLVLVAALAMLLRTLVSKRLSIKGGSEQIFASLLLVTGIISGFFTLAPYRSWIGASTLEYTSVLTIFTLTVLFYLLSNLEIDQKLKKGFIFSAILSSNLVSIIGLLSLLGISIFGISTSQTFNTVGTISTFGVFITICAILAHVIWLLPNETHGRKLGIFEQALVLSQSLFSIVVLLLIDDVLMWIMLILGLSFIYTFVFLKTSLFKPSYRGLLAGLMVLVALPFLFFFNSPFRNPAPSESIVSAKATWEISKKSMSETSWLVGSGPGTFQFAYAKHHDADINQTQVWDTRFAKGYSYFMTLIPTYGIFGAAAFLLLLVMIAIRGFQGVLSKDKDVRQDTFIFFAPWLVSAFAMFFFHANLTLMFTFFALGGLSFNLATHRSKERTFRNSPKLGYLISFIFVILSTGLVTLLFMSGLRYGAEIAFARAVDLDRIGAPTNAVVAALDKAASRNKYNDLFFRNLAQTYIIAVKEKLDELPQMEEASQEDKDLIKALTAASINSAKRATQLSPYNDTNWLIQGTVYKEFAPLMDAAQRFAIEAFEKAVELEPNNPKNHTELGKMYLSVAATQRQLAVAEDEKVRNDALKLIDENVNKAKKEFEKALELKSDYAPAQFQLSLALEQQGLIGQALEQMEAVVAENPRDVGAIFQLGLLYMRRDEPQDMERAQKAFEGAVELVPSYSNARWFLASVYEQQGNLEDAIFQVEKVLKLDGENPLVKARLERLKAELNNPTPESEPTEPLEAITEPLTRGL